MKVFINGLILIVFAGCCKVYCDGRELALSFRNFKAVDTDTVIFVSYLPNTNFSVKIDSLALIYSIPATDTTKSSFSHTISSAYDWRVEISSLNKEYKISNFQLTTERCKCGNTKYKSISSFTVDGIQKEGLYLQIE
jgi:hypothetical protein